MTRTPSDNIRFGQDPADSERLIRAWQVTRPEPSPLRWDEFWANAQASAAATKPAGLGSSHLLRAAVAASLLIGLTAFALRDRNDTSDLPRGMTVATGPNAVVESVEPSANPGFSIDLGQDDSLAVIRTGYEECPLPNPCVDAVRPYTLADSGETSLASNFQLLNEFESIAAE